MDLSGKTLEQIRLDALIGRGGMGAVYRGFDLRLKRPVAVKVLRSRSRRATEARGRFVREARILSRLDHPGICRVYDLIEHPEADLLVLELIRGQTLGELWFELGFAEKLVLARDIADALAAAHRQLILHRDLKPDNVMVTEEGQAKLLDFGIARPLLEEEADESDEAGPRTVTNNLDEELTLFAGALGAPGSGTIEPLPDPDASPDVTFRTLRGVTVGTVAYMSPEQALGHDLTVASDMYAYGILLQEMFTGKRAYPRLSVLELFQRVARANPEPIGKLDDELAKLIGELEMRNPARRPSAVEARDRVQRLLDRPARKRQLQRRVAAALAATIFVLTGLGSVIYSRFEARRQAMLAERFAQDASAVEWFLRAEHLSPAHDVRPARLQVKRQLESLAANLPAGKRLGRVAGSYALGRAHLALNDLPAARRHLRAAWEGGYQQPEVASYLGLTLIRLHSALKEKAERIPDDKHRAEKLEELAVELAQPGIELLGIGRFASVESTGETPVLSIEPDHYPQAMVAFEQGHFEEALDQAAKSASVWPWFYEADLLAAQILRNRSVRFGVVGEYEAAHQDLEAASSLATAASEVARSDPRVLAELCAVESEVLSLQAAQSSFGEELRIASFNRGEKACRQALALDPENPRSLRLLAQLLQRGAEIGAIARFEGDDPRPVLEEAALLARTALSIDQGDAPSWKALGDIYSMWADWEIFRGLDPAEAIGRMQEAYEQAVELTVNEGGYLNSLGNAHCFRGELEKKKGDDPRASFAAAAEAYWRSHRLNSVSSFSDPLVNLAVCLSEQVDFEIHAGISAGDALDQLDSALAKSLTQNSRSSRLWRQIGETRRLQAIEKALRGEATESLSRQSLEAHGRSLEIEGDDFHSITMALAAHATVAWLKTLGGDDPGAELAEAERLGAALLAEEAQWQPALMLLARSSRVEASHLLRSGPGAARQVLAVAAKGRTFLDKALADDPGLVSAHLEIVRLAMIEAAAKNALGESVEVSWRRAEEALAEATRLWPRRAEVPLARAALASQKARLGGKLEDGEEWDALLKRALSFRQAFGEHEAPAYWLAGAEPEGQISWPF